MARQRPGNHLQHQLAEAHRMERAVGSLPRAAACARFRVIAPEVVPDHRARWRPRPDPTIAPCNYWALRPCSPNLSSLRRSGAAELICRDSGLMPSCEIHMSLISQVTTGRAHLKSTSF